jgi:hypothetical protein
MDTFKPSVTVKAPAAYAIPPQFTEVQELIKLHGIRYGMAKAFEGTYWSYAFSDVKFGPMPFEGRHQPQFKVDSIEEPRRFATGTMIVPVDQPRGKLVLHLLEPAGPDSLVRWGFFNAFFERKEYFEDYAMDPIARKLLENDRHLKSEFEKKLREDPEFAKSPQRRLQWFYERSQYDDERYNKYPIAKLSGYQMRVMSRENVIKW